MAGLKKKQNGCIIHGCKSKYSKYFINYLGSTTLVKRCKNAPEAKVDVKLNNQGIYGAPQHPTEASVPNTDWKSQDEATLQAIENDCAKIL